MISLLEDNVTKIVWISVQSIMQCAVCYSCWKHVPIYWDILRYTEILPSNVFVKWLVNCLYSNIASDQMLYTEKDLEKSMDKIETVNFHQASEAGLVIDPVVSVSDSTVSKLHSTFPFFFSCISNVRFSCTSIPSFPSCFLWLCWI